MANSTGEDPSDDFLEQILGFPNYGGGGGGGGGGADTNLGGNDSSNLSGSPASMMLQLGLADGSEHLGGVGIGAFHHGALDAGCGFPLGTSSEQGSFGRGGFMRMDDALRRGHRFGDGGVESRAAASVRPIFRESPMSGRLPSTSNPPAMRPRTRARRGQATDPHSIAERLRRERITERVRALQELVPGVNKTDRAVMVDEIVDYVKFLRLQVKVLSMSRLGGAGAVAPLVTDIPISSVEEESDDGGPAWEKLSSEGTEQQVAKLMEEDVGAAMQFLQSKALCIMPISLASTIYHMQPPDVKPQTDPV